jgi:carboxyl-terminal processing protease
VPLKFERQGRFVNRPLWKGRFLRNYERKFVSLLVCVFSLFSLSSCAWTAQPDRDTFAVQAVDANSPEAVAFAKIYSGDFAGAEKLIQETGKGESKKLADLSRVIEEYNAISVKREADRKAAYKKQLAQLEKYRHPRKASEVNDVNAVKNINDPNDPNAVFDALLVIVKTHEMADKEQKTKLLEDPFVKEIIEKSLARCGCFESNERWLDSLTSCYGRLMAIYEDNKTYRDHADELADKELLKVSLQDSPCESWKSRYQNVRKEMFIKALRGLDFNYVSIINYSDMAQKAIERCRLLGEVIFSVDALRGQFLKDIDPEKYADWSNGLDSILAQTKKSLLGMDSDKFVDIFDDVLALNEATIKLPQEVLVVHFSEASLSALDPYTNLIWPEQLEEFKKNLTNEFTGIGIEISKADGPLKVSSLLPDTPAYTSGLDAGDIIEAIDGVSTKDMPIGCAVRKITGPAGTTVMLTILHTGETKPVNITITRGRIIVPTIRGWQRVDAGEWQYMLDKRNGIGYIRITSFSEKTDNDLEGALKQLESQGLKGLIIDLRFDSGGYLETAVNVVDKFVEKGLIVRTQPRFGLANWASAHTKAVHRNYPLVVLINGGSASASEIVAGALQDPVHKRAIMVGTRSYGKGSVQTIASIPGGAQLKYTMAYYHLPSGQRVEGRAEMEKAGRKEWGIAPDVEVEMTSEELKKMIDVERDNDVLVKAGHKDGNTPIKRHSMDDTIAADPQLAIAELIIKAKLIEGSAAIAVNKK